MTDCKGKVYLVGAGPGDGRLLTLKGADLLKSAQVIVYDRLVDDAVLSLGNPDAEYVYVGKNEGNHPVPQGEINRILLEKALENRIVVRLKGGDPFLFGRGGEELELLCRHGVPFEVVPGVTSAFAAPAYGGIPVTHRDYCSSVHVITGHLKKGGDPELDFETLVKLDGTLIFMMSSTKPGYLADGLIKAGMDQDMPCAIIENGTLPCQRKLLTPLKDLEETALRNQLESPAVIVVGKVCSLSGEYDWFGRLPLRSVRVLITRSENRQGRMKAILEALGASVTSFPCIKTEELFFTPDLAPYSILVFTSPTGVDCFFKRLWKAGGDSRLLHGKKIAVVGKATGLALKLYGIQADFIPSIYDGKHLAEELLQTGLLEVTRDKLGLFRAQEGSPEIIDVLSAAGVNFQDIPVYRTLRPEAFPSGKPALRTGKISGRPDEAAFPERQCTEPPNASPIRAEQANAFSIQSQDYDYIAFTSVSCVRNFVQNIELGSFTGAKALCIGPQTAAEAERQGLTVLTAREASLEAMAEKLVETVGNEKGAVIS